MIRYINGNLIDGNFDHLERTCHPPKGVFLGPMVCPTLQHENQVLRMNPVKVFIVDDHYMVIEGIRALLQDQKDIVLMGHASNADSFRTPRPM
jgi:PleD family two-component response regulator